MRGKAERQATMRTTVTPDALVPQRHPIRRIKPMAGQALAPLSPTFDRYTPTFERRCRRSTC